MRTILRLTILVHFRNRRDGRRGEPYVNKYPHGRDGRPLFITFANAVRQWGIIGTILVCALIGAWAILKDRSHSLAKTSLAKTGGSPSFSAPSQANAPMVLEKAIDLAGILNEKEIRDGIARLRRRHPNSLSQLLHVLRVFGKETLVAEPVSEGKVRALEIILDAEKSQGFFRSQPSLFETRTGVRCRLLERGQSFAKQREREAHTDQLLAVLAELGIRLDHPIRMPAGECTVRDLLIDAVANFALDQKEIEWSALAFTLYLPPQRAWTDKFGAPCDFDKLAKELLTRPLREQSCGGSHILFALTAMLQINARANILSPDTRKRVRSYLARTVGNAMRGQDPSGYWSRDWYRRGENLDVGSFHAGAIGTAEVLLTGHHLEWMIFLPPDLLPPRDCLIQASNWLLQRLRTATPEIIEGDYCPYSHAGRAVVLLSTESKQ